MKLTSFILIGSIVGSLSFSPATNANERILSVPALKRLGMKPFVIRRTHTVTPPDSQTPWPIAFKSTAASIAQNYAQHQDFGNGQYYHGGCDLRAEPDSWVTAPVSGRLEAGYYGYQTTEDGHNVKWWKPWDGNPTDDLYFEVAVITDAGYRYEMHHVNPMNLPMDIVRLLNTPQPRVTAGTHLGHVAKWPSDYDHVHYNIYRPDGVLVNPERFSLPVSDHSPPKLLGVFASDAQSKITPLSDGGRISKGVTELVVETVDSRDGNQYVQVPLYFSLEFDSGPKSGWDFTNYLTDSNGLWVDIRRFFIDSITLSTGRTIENTGNYGQGHFLVRVPVPAHASGAFVLKVGDTSGNKSEFHGSVD